MSAPARHELDDDAPVDCPRLERALPVSEHLACAYCFGGAREVRSGVLASFCDYRKGVDPVNFGDPEGLGR